MKRLVLAQYQETKATKAIKKRNMSLKKFIDSYKDVEKIECSHCGAIISYEDACIGRKCNILCGDCSSDEILEELDLMFILRDIIL